jgi:hypothetical protein
VGLRAGMDVVSITEIPAPTKNQTPVVLTIITALPQPLTHIITIIMNFISRVKVSVHELVQFVSLVTITWKNVLINVKSSLKNPLSEMYWATTLYYR